MIDRKEIYVGQELRWRQEITRLRERLSNAEARLEYYQARIAVLKHGPRILEAAG